MPPCNIVEHTPDFSFFQYKEAEDNLDSRIAAAAAERDAKEKELAAAKQRRREEQLREVQQHVESEQRRKAELRQKELENELAVGSCNVKLELIMYSGGYANSARGH